MERHLGEHSDSCTAVTIVHPPTPSTSLTVLNYDFFLSKQSPHAPLPPPSPLPPFYAPSLCPWLVEVPRSSGIRGFVPLRLDCLPEHTALQVPRVAAMSELLSLGTCPPLAVRTGFCLFAVPRASLRRDLPAQASAFSPVRCALRSELAES